MVSDSPRGGLPDRPRPAPKEKKDKDYSISVSFNGDSTVKVQGGTVKNGPSEINTTSGPVQGVGFTITGHVPSGERIAQIGGNPTDPNNKIWQVDFATVRMELWRLEYSVLWE